MKIIRSVKKNILALYFFTASFLFAGFVFAQGLGGYKDNLDETAVGSGVKSDVGLIDFFGYLIQAVLGILGVIFVLLILLSGFNWLNAKGEEDKILKAKKTLINSIIGLAIVIFAYVIAYFVSMAIESSV